ncbi:MAG: DUF1588 domain-containing protein [Proteobacteria bacterium]|nr:DUF1588 domain-containing protein [Pseudomonadota bacterium]
MGSSADAFFASPARARFAALVATCLSLIVSFAPALAGVAASGGEQHMLEQDPKLYILARKYFPSDDATPPPRRIFRLTRDQIDLTVRALLPGYVTRSVKATMPRDPLQTNYEYAELIGFNQANTGALATWIGEIAARVRQSPSAFDACAGADRQCHISNARNFILSAFRGDPGGGRIDRVAKFYAEALGTSGPGEAAGDLVEVVLNSPDFLFRRELATGADNRLSAADRLTELTYMLADVPPTRLALDDAAKLLDGGERQAATIAGIVGSREARAKLRRFLKAWLEIREPAEFTISRAAFPEFTPELSAAMVEATDRLLASVLAKPEPRLTDLTLAKVAFVSKPVESLYGVKAADPQGKRPVPLDPARRLGVFSEPAVIASHSGPTDSRLVKRGVFWVRKMMCMELDPPPKGTDTALPPEGALTQRAKLEAVTAKRACIGCHRKMDPFGFFQESYDALGRWRTTDNGLPLDTAVAIDFLDEKTVQTPGPVEALRVLTASAMFKQCFVRQMFRFYMGRGEEAADDPLLRRLFFDFANLDEQRLFGVLATLAGDDRVCKRR